MFDHRQALGYGGGMLLPKTVEERDEEYLDFIRSEPCIRCHAPAPSEAHHHPLDGHSGTALKTSDYRALPLCFDCHVPAVHQHGKSTFWGDLEQVEAAILRYNIRFFFLGATS